MKTIEKKAVPDRQLGPLEYLSVEEGDEYEEDEGNKSLQ